MEYMCCFGGKSIDSSAERSSTEWYTIFTSVFWRLHNTFLVLLDKKTFLLLLVLLNPLLVVSSPTQHHRRHRHLRHTVHGDRLCDKPHTMTHPHDKECHRSRAKRDVNHMNLREGENATLCDYRVCVDKDADRVPQEIHRVYCLESGCRCQGEGSYRCTQLTDRVEVWYGLTSGQARVDRVEVEVGCVCAASHAQRLANLNLHGVDR